MKNHRLHRLKPQITQIILFFTLYSLLSTLVGCEAFVRKFTRKPKRENLPKEEMVLLPEEYRNPQISKEELYRQYFFFWKAWHDELIISLNMHTNYKKRVECVDEAIKNLINLRTILNEERQRKLDIYIRQLTDLKDSITEDIYGNRINIMRQNAERIKRSILRDFSYSKISKDIS